MSTKTFTNRSTKTEILKAYNELAKEPKQARGGAPAAAASPSATAGVPAAAP